MDESLVFSIVVPLLNERENVVSLHDEIMRAMEKYTLPYEIIYVNDGSCDGTNEILRSLSNCTVIELRRSFGQTAALMAGISEAKGTVIGTLGGDLQNDPNDLLDLFQYMDNMRVDMVVGWRQKRGDQFEKRLFSFVAYFLRQILLGDKLHDAGCGLKVFRREVMTDLVLYGEMYGFFALIVKSRGFTVLEFPVVHRVRKAGKSKYSWKHGASGFLDMVGVWFWGGFSSRPLHLLVGGGLSLLFVSFFILIVNLTDIFGDFGFLDSEQWIIFAFLVFILGIQLIVSGLIADICVQGFYAMSGRTVYVVKDIRRQL